MADYIDKQKTIEAIHSAIYSFICGAEDGDELSEDEKLVLSVNKAICTAIKAFPSADVQPVRHGHWDETTEPCGWTDEDCAECSECHNTFVLGDYTMEDIRESFKYCPNCGARMDEGSE